MMIANHRPAGRAYNSSSVMHLKIRILRYVEAHFPGWVECEFTDAENNRHSLVEKVPIVSEEDLGPDDSYPKNGLIRCEILERLHCAGRDLLRVTTEHPDGVETKGGASKFLVLSSQIVPAEETIEELEKKAVAYEEQARSQPNQENVLLHKAGVCREWIAALKSGHWKS